MKMHEAATAAALVATGLAWASSVRAEQAFLCEEGRIALARVDADLERLKREDACVAAYFGLKVEEKAPVQRLAGADASDRSSNPIALRPSSAREVVTGRRHSAARRFHEVGEHMRPAAASEAPAQALTVINAHADAKPR